MSNAANQSKPFVRVAVIDDCAILASTLRQADRDEIAAASGNPPLAALVTGFYSGRTYTVEWGGRVVAMFGVVPLFQEGHGAPWMLASDDLEKIKRPFIKECRKYVQEMSQQFPILHNMVWSKNAVHITWLKWLGFKVFPAVSHGINGELFHPFNMVKHV